MFRKIALGLIAAAALSVSAVAPASAHGLHGWGHGWGYGLGLGFAPGLYVSTGTDCLQTRMVQTRHGLRLRTINVCAYDVY